MDILYNGELSSENKNIDRKLIDSEGFNFGYGLFETFKVENSNILFWEEHIERLKKGLRSLGMTEDMNFKEFRENANRLIEHNGLKLGMEIGALKIIVSKAGETNDIIMTTRKSSYTKKDYIRGYGLVLGEGRKNPYSILSYVKSMNYAENMFEKKRAIDLGADDSLMLNVDGYIAETSMANVFFIKEDTVYTPEIGVGILNGTVRGSVIDMLKSMDIEIEEGVYELSEILSSDEIFITNSLMEIMPISTIKDTEFNKNSWPMTMNIMSEYERKKDG